MRADLVFLNGRVITMDDDKPRAEAVAVIGDRIMLVGDDDAAQDVIGSQTQVVDLKGRVLLPGFNDAHNHIVVYGQSLLWINCRPEMLDDQEDILTKVREKAVKHKHKPDYWIRGRGYDDMRMSQWAINRHDLDRVAPQHPVCLARVCGHVITVNSRALALAGITRETPDPPGGQIDRDATGEPTGILRESALRLIYDAIPPLTVEEIEAGVLEAAQNYLAVGITSVQNPGTGASDFRAFQSLHEKGRLPLRAYLMPSIDLLDHMIGTGLRTGFGDDRLKIGALKLFSDGGIGARTAAMHQPYKNEPENRGILWMEQEELNKIVERAHCAGFQIAIHAIGDRAVESVLNAYEQVLDRWPRADHRHRIEHCGLPSGDMLDRIVRLGLLPAPQPIFLYEGGDGYINKNLDKERAHQLYPLRRFLDAGISISASSDSPVCSFLPFQGIEAAVTRRTKDGQTIGPGQEVTVEEALRMYTLGSAYASFEEHIKGSVEAGKLADLVVLDHDPLQVPPAELSNIKVDMTVVGGKIAYHRR